MRISSNFNRFLHGVVLKEIHNLRYLKINSFKCALRPFYMSLDGLKQLLKYLDTDYPKRADKALSYTELSNNEFLSHLAFIETLMAENGLEMKYLERLENESKSIK